MFACIYTSTKRVAPGASDVWLSSNANTGEKTISLISPTYGGTQECQAINLH